MSDPLLEITGMTFRYPEAEHPVIVNLDFRFHEGERVGISAPNGAGKSTLFFLIMGLLKPDSGAIVYKGTALKKEKDFLDLRKKFGLLFQDSDDQLFCPTVLEDVAFGPLNLGYDRKEAIRISRETLARLGLEGFEERITYKLSGGEKRLVSLATILSMKPDVLLLDEPSNGLDERTYARLIGLLNDMEQSFIIISHNSGFLDRVTTIAYTMKKGSLVRL
jgi:cobalt/nickel transport system ATP-binding protein